jgi:spermidine synthase
MVHNYEHARQVKADKRFHYVEEDARVFINGLDEKFDLIINDCFDLAKISYDFSMYEQLCQLCSGQGVCSDVIYRHIFDKECIPNSIKLLKSQANLALSLLVIPEYPGILHILTIWGKNRNIHQSQKYTLNKYQKNPKNLSNFKMFVPDHLPYYLYLPPYIKKIVL